MRENRAALLGQLIAVSEWVSISRATLGCRDSDDDKLIETAFVGDATCLVTRDRDLLDMHPFRGVPILDVATFPSSLP